MAEFATTTITSTWAFTHTAYPTTASGAVIQVEKFTDTQTSFIPPTYPPASDWTLPTNVPVIVVDEPEEYKLYAGSVISRDFYADEFYPPQLYTYNSSTDYDNSTYDAGVPIPNLRYNLFPGGCSVPGTNDEDCPAVCRNASGEIFRNVTTFNNCMFAPYIVASFNGSSGNSSNQSDIDAASAFNLHPDSKIADFNITNSTINCVRGFCNDKGCGPDYNGRASGYGSIFCNIDALSTKEGYVNGSTFWECYEAMCDANTGLVDPDLGGIGVFVSYLVQLGISVGGYLLLGFFGTWTYWIVRWALAFQGSTAAKLRARRSQAVFSTYEAALLAALDEFHRTQCFFSGAIQIAAIVVMKSSNFNVRQVRTMQTNYEFMRSVAFNGIITIPFTFWYIRHRVKRSWYKFILTLSSYILSVATYATATWYYKSYTPKSSDGEDFTYCQNTDPTTQCNLFFDDSGTSPIFAYFSDAGAPIIPSVFMLYLAIEYLFGRQILSFLRQRKWWQRANTDWAEDRLQRNKARILWLVLGRLPMAGVFMFYYVCQIMSLQSFVLGKISVDDWNFGQVVGVTVWLPAILEFLQLALAGMKKGFAHRLPNGFKVTTEEESRDKGTELEEYMRADQDSGRDEDRASQSTLRVRHKDTLGIRT